MKTSRSPLFVIFTTVMMDLVGFGIVIPLVSVYGRAFGGSPGELAILGASYSLMQFLFAPIWGQLSDRYGRRPILLISLAGSTASYLAFGLASSFGVLLVSRALGGLFAANISAAQAYVADVTSPEDRAKGMGLIGAAFGIGFMLGPPIGGIAAAELGLAAPGLIAAAICGINFLVAVFRLKESLPESQRSQPGRSSGLRLPLQDLPRALTSPDHARLLLTFFFATFAFSNMEQVFSLFFQDRFGFSTGDTGMKTGLILMWSSIIGALIQGGLIRKWAPRFGEAKLLKAGLLLNALGMALFPWGPSYALYFVLILPLAFGSSLINPSVTSLISRRTGPSEQGRILGVSQGLGSLARAAGPFCGLMTYGAHPALPFGIACAVTLAIWAMDPTKQKRLSQDQGEGG